MESTKAAVENANLVFRIAVLINGGAAVSVLAFAGGLISQGKLGLGPQASDISFSLLLFALGLLAGALGIGFAYFTNYCVTGHYQVALNNGNTLSWWRPRALDAGPMAQHFSALHHLFWAHVGGRLGGPSL
jgi:hypothetical protein